MDQNQSGKKQRNPKGQRDRRRGKDRAEAGNAPEGQGIDRPSDPQPQRAVRHQRTEQPPPAAVSGEKTAAAAEETKENVVVIDHSNLKRETEEIAKLKKKYTKREIESNWHRYVAEETVPKVEETEEDAAADFSELIQAPVSKGGHLQLKEEQDWAAVSGTELGGYFTLDLRLLAQGLDCVPLHERLRLPMHVLTEEDIRHYNALAEQGKECYKPEMENPNTKAFKTLTSLVTQNMELEATHSSETQSHLTEKPFNILDIEGSTKMLLTIGDEVNQEEINELSSLQLNDNSNRDLPADIKSCHNGSMTTDKEIKNNLMGITDTFDFHKNTKGKSDKSHEGRNIVLDNSKQEENVTVGNDNLAKERVVIQQTQVRDKIIENEENYKELEEKSPISNNEQVRTLKIPIKDNIENQDDSNKDFVVKSESKEQRKNGNKLKPSVGEFNSDKSKIKRESQSTGETNLEDEDDLDFLLSLKTPLPAEPKIVSKSTSIKESSFIPGGPVVSQPTKSDEPSELDDWLDSVLQD